MLLNYVSTYNSYWWTQNIKMPSLHVLRVLQMDSDFLCGCQLCVRMSAVSGKCYEVLRRWSVLLNI